MGALCHQPFGLGRQSSGCCVRLLVLGTARIQCVSRIGEADTEKAFVAFLASLGWRPSAAPTHYLDGLLALVQKPTDSEPRLRMVENLAEGRPLPRQRRGTGQGLLLAPEVFEPK